LYHHVKEELIVDGKESFSFNAIDFVGTCIPNSGAYIDSMIWRLDINEELNVIFSSSCIKSIEESSCPKIITSG